MDINNQYQSSPSNYESVINFETTSMQKNMNNAKQSIKTNIIPEHFQQQIINTTNVNTFEGGNNFNNGNGDYANGSFNFQTPKQTYESQLTGSTIENFGHTNMQPFYKGNKTHNVDFNNGSSILEKMQGTSNILRPKKSEVKQMFEPTSNMAYVDGSPNNVEHFKNRQVESTFKNNVLPFKQERVGPGIDDGYTNKPSGGFNQSKDRDYMLPKTVDEFRTKNNPKETYGGRILQGQKGSNRGVAPIPKKNRVNSYFKNSQERYLKTGGYIKASKLREKFYMKPTKRKHISYYGSVGKEVPKNSKYAAVRTTRRNNYMNTGPRNSNYKDAWKLNDKNLKEGVSDYGKSAINNKPNERDITQKRVHTTNITTDIKKLIAPVLDIFRKTRKENTIGNSRPDGNMKAAIPAKLTVYDSSDVAKTTIKETSIHNNHTGNIGISTSKNQVKDYDDVLRTTIKETNIHNSPSTNMTPQQPKSVRVYDPEDVPDTTLKETMHDSSMGNLQSPNVSKNGAYLTNNIKMRNTNKQFTSDSSYVGTADGNVAKGGGKGYLVNRYKAKNTHKQFISNHEYTGNANSYDKRSKSYSADYNARLNYTREKISKGRAPTQNSVKLNGGEDLVNVQFKKLESDRINTREPSEHRVFQTPPTKNNCGLTITKEKLAEDIQRDRINPDILTAFNENPYTKSLSSAF
jgi:hypothetical protein